MPRPEHERVLLVANVSRAELVAIVVLALVLAVAALWIFPPASR